MCLKKSSKDDLNNYYKLTKCYLIEISRILISHFAFEPFQILIVLIRTINMKITSIKIF